MIELNSINSITKFKAKLIAEIPYAPNNKTSKDYLLLLDIGDVIHVYDFWQQRLIDSSPRNVIVNNKIRNSTIYLRNRQKINILLERVKAGVDVNKYLSHQAHSATFDVDDFKRTHSFNSFRDQILICEGFHHLHLEEFPSRTNEVIIAHVTSKKFEIVQVTDHGLFENNQQALSEYKKHITEFVLSKHPNGATYIGGVGGGMQNLAGSSIQSTFNQVHIRRILQNVELLNGGIENYTKKLYKKIHNRDVEYTKPEWQMLGREIIIFDKKNKITFRGNQLLFNFN